MERQERNRLELETFKLMITVFKDGLASSSGAQAPRENPEGHGLHTALSDSEP